MVSIATPLLKQVQPFTLQFTSEVLPHESMFSAKHDREDPWPPVEPVAVPLPPQLVVLVVPVVVLDSRVPVVVPVEVSVSGAVAHRPLLSE
jgi:hypothetical protein